MIIKEDVNVNVGDKVEGYPGVYEITGVKLYKNSEEIKVKGYYAKQVLYFDNEPYGLGEEEYFPLYEFKKEFGFEYEL